MKYYRNKPLMVEAVQVKSVIDKINSKDIRELEDWVISSVFSGKLSFSMNRAHLGNHTFFPEDYIVLNSSGDVEGEVCSDFSKKYVPILELAQTEPNYLQKLVAESEKVN